MKLTEYVKLLIYFDGVLRDNKITETNWHYTGLILDAYFEMSILSIDYLNIEDYFSHDEDFDFSDSPTLNDQFSNVKEEKRLKLLEKILNILKYTSFDRERANNIYNKATTYLKRNHITVLDFAKAPLKLSEDKIVGQGSYCVVKKYKEGILEKELNHLYREDSNLQKRMKYEYENMYKLRECPQVLNVYSFNTASSSYLMERADINLFDYLRKEVDISFEQKIKIIYDVLNGMKYAHDNDIIHRDLHLGNILKLGNDFVLCDFGLSKDESIERSLKSSATEKNNHIFVDPLAIGDFTKLDKKSDIYSLGKIIDYVFTTGNFETNHLFTFIVEKCTSRSKEKRYETIKEILNDIEFKLSQQAEIFDKQQLLEKIQNNKIDIQVIEFINVLINSNNICNYLVENKLSSFGEVILQFELVDQTNILQAINIKFAESTGYGQFTNYDIFTSIAHYICTHTQEEKVFSIAIEILRGCSQYRYSAKAILEKVEKNIL